MRRTFKDCGTQLLPRALGGFVVGEKVYDITIGRTPAEDRICAPQLEVAIAAVMLPMLFP
jgi:hypothetical protein